jgi:transposase
MEMNQITKIALAWNMFSEGMNKSHIANKLSVNRETVRIWISAIQNNPLGLTGFIDNYLSAKKGERSKRKIDGLLKERIYLLREDNRDCCGQKIKKYLKNEYNT